MRSARSRGARRAALLVAALRRRPGNSSSSRSGRPDRTYKNYEASRRARPRCCRRARSSTASWPTGWRSRTASGRSSSAAGSATTRTGRQRDDVRYILTYVAPSLGYESRRESRHPGRARRLPGSPHHHDVRRRRNPTGHDRAALIDKFGGGRAGPADTTERAQALTSAPSRRTPTCASAPSTTTRCSSTTAAPRSSRSSSAPASRSRGRVLDAGCGGGGMPLSLAEEAALGRRHRSRRSVPGRRRAARPRTRHRATCTSRWPTAWRCRFATARSTWCCRTPSSSTSPTRRSTCASARACSRPAGTCYLSTAPYLSFAGAHLPRLKVPVPLHLIVGRRVAFARSGSWRGTRRGRCKEPAHENSFIKAARRGEVKHDDLLEKVRVARLRAPDRRRRPAHRPRGTARHATVRRLPAPIGALAARQPADAGRADQQHGIRAGTRSAAERWLRSIATGRRTGARSTRCTGACSATTRPRPAGCAGTGSTAATRTIPRGEPEIWIAREGTAIVGQYATMPVRLSVAGREVRGSWGMDVMVAPERQRQGLGEVLFRTWDRNVGASLGLGLSESSSPAVPEAALAGRRPGAVPRQAADPPRAAPAELAGRRSTGSCPPSRCRS